MERTDPAAAERAARRVLEALRGSGIEVDDVTCTVSASIGIAHAAPSGATGEGVLRDADVAMYWAKEEGKGTIRVFETERHAATLDRMAIQTDLATAIERDELDVHFQAIVDLRTRAVTGFEALVRWQHPQRGRLAPVDFIPAAERSGLVVPLGSWVLREACRAARVLQRSSPGVTMSVNVSAQQLLRPGFVDEVSHALDDTGLPPEVLVLEITETVLLDDLDAATAALQALRDLGTRVAIDDFGTGYSSLSYLARLPVDILKVDGRGNAALVAVDPGTR
jgi:predicted signal transduction protein with EAL and GGDEF domain